jgi:hypothetical protein
MSLVARLATFRTSVVAANDLAADALRMDAGGVFLAAPHVREQGVVASFLNFHIAWETFLEAAFLDYMEGLPGVLGGTPTRISAPPTREHALKMLIGTQRFFDFGNNQSVFTMAELHFANAGPFQHVRAHQTLLDDMKIMRNCCAHIQTTTQQKLDGLAQRVLQAAATYPTKVDVFLRTQHPAEPPGVTIMSAYQQRVDVVAELIANG